MLNITKESLCLKLNGGDVFWMNGGFFSLSSLEQCLFLSNTEAFESVTETSKYSDK